jgi:putative DNA methylase
MIPKECKRLAEVDFPIAVVSKHSAREKSIRHGHPSTLHLWWARRPLAACRAILLGLLLPDPCDKHCPEDFKDSARHLLPKVQGTPGKEDIDLRQALLKFIGDFANWDLSSYQSYLEVSRGLVKAAHPEEPPLVVDPFAGGGSIPLEALRLGCDAFASDLNPVACLILKVMLEDIPRQGPKLAEKLRKVGKEIKEAAEKELAEFYPPDPDGSRPIAYLWARTVKCESPNCGAEIPLMRSFWLSKKAGRRRALRYRIVRPQGKTPYAEFEIFEPKNDKEVPIGTVTRAKATCPCCNTVLPPERVRVQLAICAGGADVIFNDKGIRSGGARLLAVVTLKPGEQGRSYRQSDKRDYEAIFKVKKYLIKLVSMQSKNDLNPIPNEALPPIGTLGFRVQRYGMKQWGDLFTSRQKLALLTFSRITSDIKQDSTKSLTTVVIGRCADYWSSGVVWAQEGEFVAHTFGRHALPLVWDFAEAVPFTESSGNYQGAIDWVSRVVENVPLNTMIGNVNIADACASLLPDDACNVWFTDPPYYDAVPYSDLSDFFFVWLKRALPEHPLLRDPFDPTNCLTPKLQEIVQDETKLINDHKKDRDFFEHAMAKAFAEGRRILRDEGISSVVFAHKTTEGWEALLSGMIQAGWTITGSWPIATERPGRLRSQESAALATSVHLVCRPRPEDSPIGDWGDVLRELPNRVGIWMERLQKEHIRGADLVFACIGPALEIYSRYSKVVDAEEREIPLGGNPEASDPHKRGFLAYVWEVIGRTALQQVLGPGETKAGKEDVGALEEDARLTALFLWTLQSTNGNGASTSAQTSPNREEGEEESDEEEEAPKKKAKGFSLVFDVVRRFAQPLGIHLPEWEGRIIETSKGVVRLMSVHERAKQLFGVDGAQAVAEQIESDSKADMQTMLFPEIETARAAMVKGRGRKKRHIDISDESLETKLEATTLDRVHAAMLLQSSGQANALRTLLRTEQDRGPDFLRLANALSALYPKGSEEKRLVDAMLLAVPR